MEQEHGGSLFGLVVMATFCLFILILLFVSENKTYSYVTTTNDGETIEITFQLDKPLSNFFLWTGHYNNGIHGSYSWIDRSSVREVIKRFKNFQINYWESKDIIKVHHFTKTNFVLTKAVHKNKQNESKNIFVRPKLPE